MLANKKAPFILNKKKTFQLKLKNPKKKHNNKKEDLQTQLLNQTIKLEVYDILLKSILELLPFAKERFKKVFQLVSFKIKKNSRHYVTSSFEIEIKNCDVIEQK